MLFRGKPDARPGKVATMSRSADYVLAEDPEIYRSVDPEGIFSAMLSSHPAMLTREEVAAILRRDPKTVSEMCRSGLIPDAPLPPDGSRMKLIIPKLSLIKLLVGVHTNEKRRE